MKMIRLADMTMRQKSSETLTFKEKLELVRILDRLHTDVIEMDVIRKARADSLCIKSVADAVVNAAVAVPVTPSEEAVAEAWTALARAKKPRISVTTPVSLVQMEYLMHKKPEAVKEAAVSAVRFAKTLCPDVELVLGDATRSEAAFLYDVIAAAIEAGASVITLRDEAGLMLPAEAGAFVKTVRENVPALSGVTLAVAFADTIALADACAVEAILAGADEVKASIHPDGSVSLGNLARILSQKSDALGAASGVRVVEMKRSESKAYGIFHMEKSKTSPFEDGVRENSGEVFTIHDDQAAVIKETVKLGYDLSAEDADSVYEEFRRIAAKKDGVTSREIDAIVASSAMQVPATYEIADFIITSGHSFSATAHIRLLRNGTPIEGVAIGDGPVDASILAIEQIIGHHYELDDFQIRSVTEGREAMGETVIKLRSDGRVYSGHGLSTDIISSSIRAYISALNKIVYEEEMK